jgi:integrase
VQADVIQPGMLARDDPGPRQVLERLATDGTSDDVPAREAPRRARVWAVHARMLRHSCGYALAKGRPRTRRIQDWLGHQSIQHTTRDTQLNAAPLEDFWS